MKAIYLLTDPRDRRVRYVGQTNDPRTRLRTHINSPLPSIAEWIEELEALGLVPAMVVIGEVDDEVALLDERTAIDFFRDTGHPLLNREPGRPAIGRQRPATKKRMFIMVEVTEEQHALLKQAAAAWATRHGLARIGLATYLRIIAGVENMPPATGEKKVKKCVDNTLGRY